MPNLAEAIAWSPQEFASLLRENPHMYIMGYMGEKDKEGWAYSTSRFAMNRLWGNFAYIPINIADSDETAIKAAYEIIRSYPNALGINHTNPHKSNDVMRSFFSPNSNPGGLPVEGDVVIRSGGGFRIADCNGIAGAEMACELLSPQSIHSATVAVIGAFGASGRLITQALLNRKPGELILCDIAERPQYQKALSELAESNGVPCSFFKSVDELPKLSSPVCFINATRHTNARSGISIIGLLNNYNAPGNAALDLIMADEAAEAELSSLSMKTYNGYDYGAKTNWLLTLLIEEVCPGLKHVSEAEFRALALSAPIKPKGA